MAGHPAGAVNLAGPHPGWVATWAASPQPRADGAKPLGGFRDQTVRDIIDTSVGGTRLRVRISNLYGDRPLVIGAASVAAVLTGAALASGSTRQLTFGGKPSVAIPAHAAVTSDPAAMPVAAEAKLAISLFLPQATGPTTSHLVAEQVNYVARGNHAADPHPGAFTQAEQSWYFATEVDVESATADGTIVAFGDSITDGLGSALGAAARYPNFLARRLLAAYGAGAAGVVDEGIGGNRLLSDVCGSASGEARFERDALGVAGVRAVIVLLGINDIFGESSANSCGPRPAVTVAAIENGYRRLIALAHARGVSVYLGTLTPAARLSAAGAQQWAAVNDWIRASYAAHISDGVITFAAAVADPADPSRMLPSYDSGDGVHPNDLGYQAMANAVPLGWLR